MNTIITKKVTLLPAPEPITDTRIKVRLDDPNSLTWGLYSLTIAQDTSKAVIDWGDGISEEVTESGSRTHDYARTGVYEVRISNDISELRISAKNATSEFREIYAKAILEFRTAATQLEVLGMNCFYDAKNLSLFKCEGGAVREIRIYAFGLCTKLEGVLDLPDVVKLASTSFPDCPNITELRFSTANKATIDGLSGYGESFGAENAIVTFA